MEDTCGRDFFRELTSQEMEARIAADFFTVSENPPRRSLQKIVLRILPHLECFVDFLEQKTVEGQFVEEFIALLEFKGKSCFPGLASRFGRLPDVVAVGVLNMAFRVEVGCGPIFTAALNHSFYRVREQTFRYLLADQRGEKALAIARKTLQDSHSLVRQVALDYYLDAKPKEALPALEAQIENFGEGVFDLAEKKRITCVWALLRGAEVVPLLEGKLKKKTWGRRKNQLDDSLCAVSALGQLRATQSRELLESLSLSKRTNSDVRTEANLAIKLIDSTGGQKRRRSATRTDFKSAAMRKKTNTLDPAILRDSEQVRTESTRVVPEKPPVVNSVLEEGLVVFSTPENKSATAKNEEAVDDGAGSTEVGLKDAMRLAKSLKKESAGSHSTEKHQAKSSSNSQKKTIRSSSALEKARLLRESRKKRGE